MALTCGGEDFASRPALVVIPLGLYKSLLFEAGKDRVEGAALEVRKSVGVEELDEGVAMGWLKTQGCEDCYG